MARFRTLKKYLLIPRQQLSSNLVKTVFSSSYTEMVELRTVGQDTQPVGTIIQKSLKVPEWQIWALHSQAGCQKRRICSQYHQ